MSEGMRERVRERYAGAAREVSAGDASCCGSGAAVVDLTRGEYTEVERGELPVAAVSASLGCGNPVALAELSPGETVLDLGSGGGIDVLLSARRAGPDGKAYGLDMTDEMLELARQNQREAGIENVEFLKGEIEDIPLPDNHVDVVLSNCVINLSTEKWRVIEEAFRVLKPGGRLAVYDVVFFGGRAGLPAEVLEAVGMWTGCIAGALGRDEYGELLRGAGFEEVSVEEVNVYEPEKMASLGLPEHLESLRGARAGSAFIRARKPVQR